MIWLKLLGAAIAGSIATYVALWLIIVTQWGKGR